MKNVYLKAAKLIRDDNEKHAKFAKYYCCNAINAVFENASKPKDEKKVLKFAEYFKPNTIKYVWPFKSQNHRRLALLFMNEITKGE